MNIQDAITIPGSKSQAISTGATSVTVALPTTTSGQTAKLIRAVAGSGGFWMNFGNAGVTASAGNTSILITTTPTILNVTGYTHFAHIQAGSTVTASISPIEQ